MHPANLVRLFNRYSGLKATSCNLGSDGSIKFSGFNRDGSWFEIQSAGGDYEQETRRLAILQKSKVMEAIGEAINYGQPMTKPSKAKSISDRIAEAKRKFNAELDVIAGKIGEFEAKVPEVMHRVGESIKDMHSEVDTLDNDLRQLSNTE